MQLNLIWAQDAHGAIGKENALPWLLPEDLGRFRSLTLGNVVLMGRKTWESLPRRPLPHRHNIVLSSTWAQAEVVAGMRVAGTVPEALRMARQLGEHLQLYVIGGGMLYSEAIHLADNLYVTEVDIEVQGADAFAPAIPSGFCQQSRTHWMTSISGLRYRYACYGRIS